jgi:peptidyl-prolyl cis-trans isomerase A (cyclophilin A)
VKNFVNLAEGKEPRAAAKKKDPFYDGIIFHRVIPEFMIQGGDPTGTGMGDPGYKFQDEFQSGLKFDKPGRLAMANAGPNTNGSQFFITEVPTEFLNNKHTIFGQVVEGQELVKRITSSPKGAGDKPTVPIIMSKVTFERVGPVPAGGVVLAPTPAAAKPAAAKPAATKAPAKAATPVAAPAKAPAKAATPAAPKK